MKYSNYFSSRKALLFALSGNFVEMFEFSLFGIFASIISKVFFKDSLYGTLYALSILTTGFLARPIGAIIFGHIGDRYGRKPALLSSVVLMSLSTFCIGILPSSDQIGIGAPLILLFLRVLQGISCGGEYVGMIVYLFEYFPKRPGTAGALTAVSGMFGMLVAILVSYISTFHIISEWNWRIPFLIAPLFGIFILYLRNQFQETTFFKESVLKKEIPQYPLKQVFKKHLRQLLSTIFVGGFNGVLTFTLVVYLNIFVMQYNNVDFTTALGINFLAVCFFIISALFFGFIKDKWILSSSFCLYVLSIITLFISPFIYILLIQNEYLFIFLGEVIFSILAGMFSASCNVFMCDLFPSKVRYSGIALGYTLGTSLLGGTAPTFCHLLIEVTGSSLMPAAYLSFGALVGLIGCRYISQNTTK